MAMEKRETRTALQLHRSHAFDIAPPKKGLSQRQIAKEVGAGKDTVARD